MGIEGDYSPNPILLDDEKPRSYVRTGLVENYKAARNYTSRVDRSDSINIYLMEKYEEQDAYINKLTGQDKNNGWNQFYKESDRLKIKQEYNNDPNIKTRDELIEDLKREAQLSERKYEEVTADQTFLGKVGELAGSAASTLRDPINVALNYITLPLEAGGKSVLERGARMFGIGSVSEAIVQVSGAKKARETLLEREVTTEDVLKQSAVAGVANVAFGLGIEGLTGATRSVTKALENKWNGLKAKEKLDVIERSGVLDNDGYSKLSEVEQGDLLELQTKVNLDNDIDSFAKNANMTQAEKGAFRKELNNTFADIDQDRPLNLVPEDVRTDKSYGNYDLESEKGNASFITQKQSLDNSKLEFENEQLFDQKLADLETFVEENQDFTIPIVDGEGEINLKDVVADIRDDEAFLERIKVCAT
jgi:hypothetical protein